MWHQIVNASATKIPLEDGVVQCAITSPPYWGLRSYLDENDEYKALEIGAESLHDCGGYVAGEWCGECYVCHIAAVFDEVYRVLRDDGTLWLNIGDTYGGAGYSNHKNTGGAGREVGGKQKHIYADGIKHKDLVGIPWRVAFALQSRGWYLRQDIIWAKPNPMPESVKDRCTKSHEYVFLLAKQPRYFYDADAIAEPAKWYGRDKRSVSGPTSGGKVATGQYAAQGSGMFAGEMRNKRDVWYIPTKGYSGAHFAVFPEALVEPMVLAGSKRGDIVLDPFAGSGTTGVVALRHGRNFFGVELNSGYISLAKERLSMVQVSLF